MYIKVFNGVAVEFTVLDLMKSEPNLSLPRQPSDEVLAEFGMYPCVDTPKPEVDHTQNVTDGGFEQVDGNWRKVWNVTDATEREIELRLLDIGDAVRTERTQRLAACDWTQVADAPVDKQAWANYRQALRDVTEQPGFPLTVEWPTQP